MLLTKLKVKNFLSVNGECELPIDRRATVLLGANDHGKSNLLRALEHLNLDKPIVEDEQNWDSKGSRLDFEFQLSDQEVKAFEALRIEFVKKETEELAKIKEEEEEEKSSDDDESDETIDLAPSLAPSAGASVATAVSPLASVLTPESPNQAARAPAVTPPSGENFLSDLEVVREELKTLTSIIDSRSVTLTRNGIGTELSILGWRLKQLEQETRDLLEPMIPRVELFKTFSGELQDSVTAGEITETDAEFLQGIFFYAGLDPRKCEDLFQQNDETDKTLEVASIELDRELRRLWAQGVDLDLHFQLKHKGNSIELYAKDPAVKKRHARMSKRSAGVTQFFRLSMVLHARRKKNPANSYIYLFDEPGVFLHPKGQKDLLAVFEQLAGETQIIYATHSLFMLNQNYPERHRLIAKNKDTTHVDSKPYRANWKFAVDALGVRLTANILFSPNVLFVEGDSDPIYLYDLLRVLNHLGEIDADANLMGIMSYSDQPNLRFLLQTFKLESNERLIAVLFDGDSQGRENLKAISQLCKALETKTHILEAGSAIEDYCLYPDLFIKAAEATLRMSYQALSTSPPANLSEQIRTAWVEYSNSRSPAVQPRTRKPAEPKDAAEEGVGQNVAIAAAEVRVPENAGRWFKNFSSQLLGPGSGGASKVALARNYAFLSRENPLREGLDLKKVQLAKALLEQIVGSLKIPSMKAKNAIKA